MTAKAEFKKWYSACRACIRDQRLAGNERGLWAEHKGVKFRNSAHSGGHVLERAYNYRNMEIVSHFMWLDAFNDIRASWETMGLQWYRLTLRDMRSYRVDPRCEA